MSALRWISQVECEACVLLAYKLMAAEDFQIFSHIYCNPSHGPHPLMGHIDRGSIVHHCSGGLPQGMLAAA